jgi:hypothetical protein
LLRLKQLKKILFVSWRRFLLDCMRGVRACERSNFPAKKLFRWMHFDNSSRLLLSCSTNYTYLLSKCRFVLAEEWKIPSFTSWNSIFYQIETNDKCLVCQCKIICLHFRIYQWLQLDIYMSSNTVSCMELYI